MNQELLELEQRAQEAENEALKAVAELFGEPAILAFHDGLTRLTVHDIDPLTRSCRRCKCPDTLIHIASGCHTCPPLKPGMDNARLASIMVQPLHRRKVPPNSRIRC